jgi:ElaB/YqjD/DUF883 family membrane-anchored ribosome-binding protein
MSATPGFEEARDDRDPEHLQREADAIRADLDRTLNALERKLSPRQLLDRSLNYMHENGGDILQKIGATVSKHPLPLLMTSAGLLWLVAANRQSRARGRLGDSSYSPYQGDFDRDSQSFGDTSTTQSTRTRRVANQLKQRASQTLDRTRARTANLGRGLQDVVQEQPLVAGAIALAVGAIVGAAVPASQYERDLLARARTTGESLLDDLQAQNQTGSTTTGNVPPISH